MNEDYQPFADDDEGFAEDYQNLYEQWDDARKSTGRGGKLETFKQQDIPLGDTGITIRFAENRFHDCWVHWVMGPDHKKHRLVCHGDKKVLTDKNNKPALDPENCPICAYVLERELKSAYPKRNFYFRVFHREYTKEQKSQGLENKIRIFECGPQVFKGVANIAMHPQYMEDVIVDGDPVFDEKQNPKKKINLTTFDLIITRVKTGPEDFDIEYNVMAGGPSSFKPYNDEEKELILNAMPEVKLLVNPSSEAKINEALYGVQKEEEVAEESRVRRLANDPGRVSFDNE